MAFWGVVLVGPSMHYWYSGLDRIVRAPGLRGTLTKLAVDQTVFAPSIIAAFFTYTSLSEGRGIEGVKERLSQVYLPSLKANYMLWPAANFVNFYVRGRNVRRETARTQPPLTRMPCASTVRAIAPSLYRVLYANTVALVWNVYICWANGQASAGKPLDLDASASASSTEPQSPATS